MKLLATLVASCFLTLCALEADASVVSFQGQIFPGTNGVLGVPPARNFTLSLAYTPGGASATVTGGGFHVVGAPHPDFNVTGINILVGDLGVTDTANFTISVQDAIHPGITGFLTFAFSADVNSGNVASEANINAIAFGDPDGAILNAFFSTGDSYGGSIAAVPEPGSCLALLGLVGGGAWRWRRSRQQRATV